MKIIALIIFLFSTAHLFGQPGTYDPDKVNKKAIALYEKALEQAQESKFREAIEILNRAIKIDKRYADAFLSVAGLYGEMKNYDSAISNYETAKAIDSLYFQDYNLPYSINLAGKGEFMKALGAVSSFLSIEELNEKSRKAGEYRKRCYTFAIDYAKGKNIVDYVFEPKNLGDSVNSEVSEYYPTITIDGHTTCFYASCKKYE